MADRGSFAEWFGTAPSVEDSIVNSGIQTDDVFTVENDDTAPWLAGKWEYLGPPKTAGAVDPSWWDNGDWSLLPPDPPPGPGPTESYFPAFTPIFPPPLVGQGGGPPPPFPPPTPPPAGHVPRGVIVGPVVQAQIDLLPPVPAHEQFGARTTGPVPFQGSATPKRRRTR